MDAEIVERIAHLAVHWLALFAADISTLRCRV